MYGGDRLFPWELNAELEAQRDSVLAGIAELAGMDVSSVAARGLRLLAL